MTLRSTIRFAATLIVAATPMSCSNPVGPSARFLDVCEGRHTQNTLMMTVSGGLNATDIPPGTELTAFLRLGPEEAFLVQCREGTATLDFAWPGVHGATVEAYEGTWSLSLGTFWISFNHENGERLLIRLFGENRAGVWQIFYNPDERVFGGPLTY